MSFISQIGSRTLALVALMALTMLLLMALTWQAFGSASSHLQAAESVMRDFAGLAGNQFSRKLKSAVGYWVVHELGQQIQGPPETLRERVERVFSQPRAALRDTQITALRTVAAVVLWKREQASLEYVYGLAEPQRDAATAAAIAGLGPEPLSQPTVLHSDLQGQMASYAIYETGVDGARIGLQLKTDELQRWMKDVFERDRLLPPTLAPDRSGNEGIYLRVAEPDGDVLFESADRYDPYTLATFTIGDDYGGLFLGYTVSTSIDNQLAPKLVIGGLPRSRLPTLILLIVLTTGVMAATFWVALRERALIRMRSQFVARVSHELRTPLTQIRIFTETLLLGRVSSDVKRRDYLGIIIREAQRLGHLVDNILAFSGREKSARSLLLESVDISSLLEEVITDYAPLAAAKGDHIELDSQTNLNGRLDREAFKQIMLNLLDNACKYGPEGQTVGTSAWLADGRVWVSVRDAGPGIPDQEKQNVWLPYRRLQREEERALNGTGIGLSVARELILAMRGEYRVEDAEGGGARFVISFRQASNETGAR